MTSARSTVSPRRGAACGARAALARPGRWARLGGLVLVAAATAWGAEAPYRNLRDAELEYHGPAGDFADLTELPLGWFGPSDPADPLAGDAWFAANLAIDEANAAPEPDAVGAGIPPDGVALASPSAAAPTTVDPRLSIPPPLPFRLVPCWAPDPWRAGVSLLARMVYNEQPLALLGSVDSASTHLAEQVVAKAQLPLVSPFTTDKSLTLAGVAWMFACAPSDAAIARTLVGGVLDKELAATEDCAFPQPKIENQKPKILLLSGTDHESRLTAREVMREFSTRGHLPDFRFEIAPDLAIPAHVLAAIEGGAPSDVVLVATAEDSARWLTTLRARLTASPPVGAPSPVFFGSHTMGRRRFLELAGPSAEGVQFPLLWTGDAGPVATRFLERFRAARGHAPDYTAVFTYDATRLLVAAVRRAGSNRARIRESLHACSPWAGVAGPVQFDGTGQNTRAEIALGTIRDGAVRPLRNRPLSAPSPTPPPAP